MNHNQSIGKWGEDIAAEHLTQHNYEIIKRNVRTPYSEIDIIARQGDITIFVEVKTRAGDEFGGGAAAVTPWKQRRIAQMALDYLSRNHLHDRPCRFDVVTVDMKESGPEVVVYEHAFEALD